MNEEDIYWMQYAYKLALRAQAQDEVPVGAVVIHEGKLIGEGWNQPINSIDPSAHAEIMALRAAAKKIGNYRLLNTTLYSTLEPCVMCAGAMVHARIKRLLFAAHDIKAGAAGSVTNIFELKAVNHRVQCEAGILAEACAELLRNFFKQRR